EDGHLTGANPALRVLRKARTDLAEKREKVRFLTKDQVRQLLATCKSTFPFYYPFVLLLARTGLRIGEAVGLQWDDLDLRQGTAEMEWTMDDGHVVTTKSGKSRHVDLSDHLVETLRALLRLTKEKSLAAGRGGAVKPWVFCTREGTPIDADNFRNRIWPKLL